MSCFRASWKSLWSSSASESLFMNLLNPIFDGGSSKPQREAGVRVVPESLHQLGEAVYLEEHLDEDGL